MFSNSTNDREKRAKFMGEGEIKKVLITLAIPSIIAMLINAIYNVTDTAFVGMMKDTAAMGSVSVAFPIFMIIASIGQAFGVGSASYISRCLGANKKEQADKTTTIAFFSAIASGILCSIVCLAFLKPILKFAGASPTIMPYVISYSNVLLAGSVFTIVNMTLNNIIRAEGNSKSSMFSLIIGAVLNIILDPILIFGFKLGVQGAALATVLGQIASTIYLFQYFFKGKSFVKINKKLFSFSKKIYLEIFKIGLPTFLMQFLTSLAMGLLNTATIVYGDAAVAAVGIIIKVCSIVTFTLFGYLQAFQPVVGYNYGAKNYNRVNSSIKISLIWTTIFSTICTILLILNAQPIIKIFSSDPEVINIGINFLIGFNLLLPFLGFELIYGALFQALGKGKQSTILSIAREGLFFIPAIIFLPIVFKNHINKLGFFTKILPHSVSPGLYGVIYCQALADLLSIIITALLAWSLKKQFEKENKLYLSSSEKIKS